MDLAGAPADGGGKAVQVRPVPIAVIDRIFVTDIIARARSLKLERKFGELAHQLGTRQLVHERKAHRTVACQRRHTAALVVEVQRLNFDHIIDQPVAHDGIVEHRLATALGRTRHIDDAHDVHFLDEITADRIDLRAAFILKRLHRDHPALPFFADEA